MKGIVVCYDGDKSLQKDLSLLIPKNKKKPRSKKMFSILDIFAIKLNDNGDITKR